MSSRTSSLSNESSEPVVSVVIACIRDAFQISHVSQQRFDRQGVHHLPKHGCGSLRAVWVEGANCQLTVTNGTDVVIQAGGVVFIGGSDQLLFRAINPNATGYLIHAEWEIPLWLQQLLLEPHQFICLNNFSLISKTLLHDARLIAQTPISHVQQIHPVLQQVMSSMLHCGIEALEQDSSKSRLARLINHPRMGKWFRIELQKSGPAASINTAALSCNYSASGFSKSVLQTIDMPYADFMNHWRMSWSLLRFVHQRKNVKAEGDYWGYETESSFRKRFRSLTGITPGQARQLSALGLLIDKDPSSVTSTSFVGLAYVPIASESEGHTPTISQNVDEWSNSTLFDSLTGLAKPKHWSNESRKLLEAAHRYGDKMAVALIDFDHFKTINEHHGLDIGDLLLKTAAQRLQACLRSHDLMARHAGDQFVVLLGRLKHREDVATIAQKMVSVLNAPFVLKNQTVAITASIGLAWFDGGPEDMATLLRHSDVAMRRVKHAGRNDWCFFRSDMDQLATEKLLFDDGLQQAIQNRELLLHYQPQINLKTGEVVGAEVLVRWHHRELGLMTPDRWIPWIVQNGQIATLSQWVLREACRQWHKWQLMGLKAKLAININAIELLNTNVITELRGILQSLNLDAYHIDIEINDMALITSIDEMMAKLRSISELGVQLSLDDFEMNDVYVSYINSTLFQTIKIDRSFVCDIPGDQEDQAKITSIISTAHAAGVKVMAEGVERAEQHAFLATQACDAVQGWFIARPMDATVFEAWWQRQRQRPIDHLPALT